MALIRSIGLWKTKDKNGRTILTGNMGNARVLILPNNFKQQGSNHPDYNLCIGEKIQQDNNENQQQQQYQPPQYDYQQVQQTDGHEDAF